MKRLSEQDAKMVKDVLEAYINEHGKVKRTAHEEMLLNSARFVLYKIEKQSKAAKTTG